MSYAAPSLEIGRDGELLAANVRLGVTAVAMLLPIGYSLTGHGEPEVWIAVGGALLIVCVGIVIRILAARDVPLRWLGLFSATIDVSLVSGINAALILAGQPHAATSGRVFFSLYLIAIAFSSLRFDAKLCVVAGLVAVVEYGAIVLWAARYVTDPGLVSPTYGAFRWDTQIARLVILWLATAVNVMIVARSRKFLDASMHDLLTGLANRRHCELRLEAAIASAQRSGRGLLVALADIDYFKQVNDRFGHAAGDEVLRTVARGMRSFFRSSDLVGRWGGEEFMVVCPDADVAATIERIRQFQKAFSANAIAVRGNDGQVRLTLSIGVASYPYDGAEMRELIARADKRLYAAKERGRNGIVAA